MEEAPPDRRRRQKGYLAFDEHPASLVDDVGVDVFVSADVDAEAAVLDPVHIPDQAAAAVVAAEFHEASAPTPSGYLQLLLWLHGELV